MKFKICILLSVLSLAILLNNTSASNINLNDMSLDELKDIHKRNVSISIPSRTMSTYYTGNLGSSLNMNTTYIRTNTNYNLPSVEMCLQAFEDINQGILRARSIIHPSADLQVMKSQSSLMLGNLQNILNRKPSYADYFLFAGVKDNSLVDFSKVKYIDDPENSISSIYFPYSCNPTIIPIDNNGQKLVMDVPCTVPAIEKTARALLMTIHYNDADEKITKDLLITKASALLAEAEKDLVIHKMKYDYQKETIIRTVESLRKTVDKESQALKDWLITDIKAQIEQNRRSTSHRTTRY